MSGEQPRAAACPTVNWTDSARGAALLGWDGTTIHHPLGVGPCLTWFKGESRPHRLLPAKRICLARTGRDLLTLRATSRQRLCAGLAGNLVSILPAFCFRCQ